MADIAGYKLEYAGNAARSLYGGQRPGRPVVKRIAYLVRDFVELIVGYLYFGARIPLDANITFIMRR